MGRLISLVASARGPAAARAAFGRGRGPVPVPAPVVVRLSVASRAVAVSVPVGPSAPYVARRDASDAVAAAPGLPSDVLAVVLGVAAAARGAEVIFAAVRPVAADAPEVEAGSPDEPEVAAATSARLPSARPSATPSALTAASSVVASVVAGAANPPSVSVRASPSEV